MAESLLLSLKRFLHSVPSRKRKPTDMSAFLEMQTAKSRILTHVVPIQELYTLRRIAMHVVNGSLTSGEGTLYEQQFFVHCVSQYHSQC